MKDCKVCSTNAYLTVKKTEELAAKVKTVEDQIISRDKLVRASNERIKELTEKIEKNKSDAKRFRKENEKLIHENRINLKLNSYSSVSFVLQHIVPKPIGKNIAVEDVYSDGTRVGYHQVPPPVMKNFSKKKSGLDDDDDDESNDIKLPETIDVTFTSSSDEDIVQSEVVKTVVENVLKSDSDSTEDEECFLNNYFLKSKSGNNSNEESTLVMYKMFGSDKLYSDLEFPLENVNVDKMNKVFKLVEVDVSDVENLKRIMNFEKDKAY
ncbi:hypothetical protein Hanom_Chr09g00807481 [Helianthus anomalus]